MDVRRGTTCSWYEDFYTSEEERTSGLANEQMNKQTDIKTYKQRDRLIDKQIKIQADRQKQTV